MKKKFENLRVWQKAHELVLDIYSADIKFPPSERFGLKSQLRRAIVSVPANIAEGYKRQHSKELIQFLGIAQGSLEEARYYLLLLKDLGYLEQEKHKVLAYKIQKLDTMLDNFILEIKRQNKML